MYLANPNNPTGTLLDRGELRRFLGELPDGVLCVLDEAYAEYADPEPEGPALLREGARGCAVLRTFSKVYGLAALRVGYALASPEVADALDRVRPIFNVNQPAQEAALASLHERDAVALAWSTPAARASSCARRSRRPGSTRSPRRPTSSTPTCRAATATAWPIGCCTQGVIVRALRGFGAPGAIRVTAGSDEENAVFAEALARTRPWVDPGPRLRAH